MTPLDHAHAAMAQGSEAEGLRFYQMLADATLFLLLEHEAEGERINPRVFDLPDGPVLLAYDLLAMRCDYRPLCLSESNLFQALQVQTKSQ